MKVLLVGHVCLDHNVSENSSYVGPGSALVYMADYFQHQLEITSDLLAPYGRDFLQYSGELNLLSQPQGNQTLLYKNLTRDNKHRSQQCEHIEAAEPITLTDELLARAHEADIICLAPLLPNYSLDYVRRLLVAKKPAGISLLSPQGYLRNIDSRGNVYSKEFENAEEIVPLFDLVVLSEDDHTDAFYHASRWAQVAPKTHIVMTQGSFGASLINSEGVENVATNPVPESSVVDSVGCGDTFCAATANAYFHKPDIIAAIRAGNQAAGTKLFRAGPAAKFNK